MQLGHQPGLAPGEALLQELGEELVIPVAGPVLVEPVEEEVALLQRVQAGARLGVPVTRCAECGGQLEEHGGVQRELLQRRGQAVQHGASRGSRRSPAACPTSAGRPRRCGRLGDQAQRGGPSLGPLGQLARLVLVDQRGQSSRRATHAPRRGGRPGRPGRARGRRPRRAGAAGCAAEGASARRRRGAGARARGEQAIHESMGGRARGRGRGSRRGPGRCRAGSSSTVRRIAPARTSWLGPVVSDVERGLTDAGRDPPQSAARRPRRRGWDRCRVSSSVSQATGRPAASERGHQKARLAVPGLGGHDDQPARDAVSKRLHQSGPIDDAAVSGDGGVSLDAGRTNGSAIAAMARHSTQTTSSPAVSAARRWRTSAVMKRSLNPAAPWTASAEAT